MLKEQWGKQQDHLSCPVTTLGSLHKPREDQGGLLCALDGEVIQSSIELSMPAGMAVSDNGIFVAALDTIHKVSVDLLAIQHNVVSLPSFNLLHSLSRSQHGYLVASTGLDAIIEFTQDGKELWSWWATEHGFELMPTGERRVIDKTADHRGTKYGTLAQTTHVNSVAELPDGRILASLFHQGMIIAIDRESGDWQTVLEGLDHPHSIRVLTKDYVTVADTGRGRGLMVKIKDGRGKVEVAVSANTTWLQDCVYDDRQDRWVLVDGKNSRIVQRSGVSGDKVLTQLELDPEWRLYEVLLTA
jgi:hypothetical protein